jgi:arylsulfatase A-like enzyme
MKKLSTPILLLLIATAFTAWSAPFAGTRPNVVLVMTDDQGKGDLACLGNQYIRTPHTDRLHALSTRFTDFHVSPTCAPTRAAIMTGRHEFKNGVTHTILERERMTLDAKTLPEALRDAGYATGIFGKWHLGDEEPYQPHRRGFTEAFIHGAGGIGQAYDSSCADAPPNSGPNRYFDNVLRHNGRFVQTKGFCTDVFFQAALGWIRERQEAGQPFFACITPNAPHGPMIAPEKYKQRFLDMGFDENSAARMGMIENIDDNLGLLMDKLAEWKLEENTLLIFMTDNGQAGRSGRLKGKQVSLDFSGFKTGKGSPFEGGTSVPAFWRWKGRLREGADIDALTAHIDLFPTFAALTGAKVPAGQVEGRSLLPLLENPRADWADRFLFTHQGRWKKGENPDDSKFKNCAVRNARFRLVNNQELYDIAADPFEKSNVIDQHPGVVAKMRAAYDTWWKETRPLMVNEAVLNSPVKPFFELYEKQLKAGGIPDWKAPKL